MWYQFTIKGGREGRDVDALQLAQTCEKLGAGKILLNCIDKDGTNSGFDIELINHIREMSPSQSSPPVMRARLNTFQRSLRRPRQRPLLAAGIFPGKS